MNTRLNLGVDQREDPGEYMRRYRAAQPSERETRLRWQRAYNRSLRALRERHRDEFEQILAVECVAAVESLATPKRDRGEVKGLHTQAVALVRARLVELNLTQAELAKRLGWSEKHMSRVLCGHAEPSMASLDFMAHVLDLEFTVGALVVRGGSGR